ncbi:hypothetical protein BD770DRAFT_386073 [Pilaira anomala]|nr:hypothetical protein BD770DRAFT_386073 [Pilaira anomala]
MEALEKRAGTFATHTEHTSAFTTVHIIAAVIGVLGAIAVAVTVIMFCRKRKSKTALKMKADIERNMIERIPTTTPVLVDRFDQFATDFDPTVTALRSLEGQTMSTPPPPPAKLSPMMQQYQLQLKLLQVPTHHRASSSSSAASNSSQHLPPPPYQP